MSMRQGVSVRVVQTTLLKLGATFKRRIGGRREGHRFRLGRGRYALEAWTSAADGAASVVVIVVAVASAGAMAMGGAGSIVKRSS